MKPCIVLLYDTSSGKRETDIGSLVGDTFIAHGLGMHDWVVWKELEGDAEAQLWAGTTCMAIDSADSQAHLLISSRTGPGKPAALMRTC